MMISDCEICILTHIRKWTSAICLVRAVTVMIYGYQVLTLKLGLCSKTLGNE